METNEDYKIHIPAKKREYVNNSKLVRVSADAYNILIDICNESAISLSEVASILILEASKHVVYDE